MSQKLAKEFYCYDFDWEEVVEEGQAFVAAAKCELTDESTEKLHSEAHQYWDTFYTKTRGNFFKPRNFILKVFPELSDFKPPHNQDSVGSPYVLEIGCGNGSNVFPIVSTSLQCFVVGVDFSAAAVKACNLVAGSIEGVDKRRCAFAVGDIVSGLIGVTAALDTPESSVKHEIRAASFDFVLCTFVLSALHPSNFEAAVRSMWEVAKPGGIVGFRDYGLYDMVMLRQTADKQIQPNWSVRGDGTLTYYFSVEEVRSVFENAGFRVIECTYHTIINTNRKTGVKMKRVWVHGKFEKPS